MYENETKYYTVKSNINFDYSNWQTGRDRRVELGKKINKFLNLKVLLFESASNSKKVNISVSVSDKTAFRGIKEYDVDGRVEEINLRDDRFKELVHVNDPTNFEYIEEFISNEVIPELESGDIYDLRSQIDVTDKEKLIKVMDDFGVGYEEISPGVIEMDGRDNKVDSYIGFFTHFEFDENEEFQEVIIGE